MTIHCTPVTYTEHICLSHHLNAKNLYVPPYKCPLFSLAGIRCGIDP